jgi:hypothetical protein
VTKSDKKHDKELQQKHSTEPHLLAMPKGQRPEKKDLPHDSLRWTYPTR